MKPFFKICVWAGCVMGLAWGVFFALDNESNLVTEPDVAVTPPPHKDASPAPALSPARVESIPAIKILENDYHVFQTFNNCAPAALSMALSYYGVEVSQETLAEALRPYNNRTGVNDDKSTPPEELARKAQEYGLIPYHRAHGSIDILKQFIAHDMPIVIRTLLEPGKDYAHYRVIKGYDDARRELIQDDSLQGKNLRYSYDAFLDIWEPFNYAYLVLAPPEKQKAAESILGEDRNARVAWQNALQTAKKELSAQSGNRNAAFNTSVALYYLGSYAAAVTAFETVEARLPMRTLWYQIEPIQAYFETGDYERVFRLTDRIFNDNNRGFSELYVLRGKSYAAQGDAPHAQQEFEKAVFYNKNLKL